METGEDVLAQKQSATGCPDVFELRTVEEKNEATEVSSPSFSLSTGRTTPAKRERKVSFPDDSSLVRSLEPFDPWKDAGNCTSKEVIDAYRQICTKLKVKPCEKLIKQLEACEQFNDRIDVIDLRGIKLDLKSCETLEEVLRKVRTKTLDLENTSLEDEGTLSILEMVEFYHSACKLNLAYNSKIRNRGWQALGRTVKRTPCLEYLDVRHTVWTEQSIPLLGRSLRLNCPLTILHMEATNLSGRPLFLLANAIKTNQILRDLFLGDNKLVPSDGQCIGTMLKSNSTLRLLDLRNNTLQDMGLGHICEGLAGQSEEGLETLVLWNNQLTFQGMGYLSKALVSLKNLQTLNLGHNRLTNEGIHNLKDGLLLNKSLQRLGLLNTRLSSEGIIALAEVIADSNIMLRLDIRENDPYVGGLMALSLALKVNTSLVRLDLDKDLKKEPGMETTQRCLLADIYSYCQRNKTSTEHSPQVTQNSTSNTTALTDKHNSSPSSSSNATCTSKDESVDLIQLNSSPQKSRFDLKHFGGFTFPPSRFRITRIFEASSVVEPARSPESPHLAPSDSVESQKDSSNSSSEEDSSDVEGLLVDIDPEPQTVDISTDLEQLDLDVFESDSSSSQDADWESRMANYACGSRESVDSLGTPFTRSHQEPPHDDKEEHSDCFHDNATLANVNSSEEWPSLANIDNENDKDFEWMQQLDGVLKTSANNTSADTNPPLGDLLVSYPNSTSPPVGDLLGSYPISTSPPVGDLLGSYPNSTSPPVGDLLGS